jgi:hypothetical protein
MGKKQADRLTWGKIRCSRCGGSHANRRELRDCRERGGAPAEEVVEKVGQPRHAGSETTHYVTDPFRGNARDHAIAKLLRGGKSPRKVAKIIGVSISVVEEVRAKLP